MKSFNDLNVQTCMVSTTNTRAHMIVLCTFVHLLLKRFYLLIIVFFSTKIFIKLSITKLYLMIFCLLFSQGGLTISGFTGPTVLSLSI